METLNKQQQEYTILTIGFVVVVLLSDYLASLAPKEMLVIGPIAVSWGTPLIGFVLALRDTIQKRHGVSASYLTVAVTAVCSVVFAWFGGTSWAIILASFTAFVLSEVVDQLVYSRLKNHETLRIIGSNFVSEPVDSAIFVSMAFGFSWEFVLGQWLIKMIASFVYVVLRRGVIRANALKFTQAV